MPNTTVEITHTVIAPGTSFSIDVTTANLNTDDDSPDYDIYHDGTHQPARVGYTKSGSGTSIDYSGSSLTGVVVTVRRHTSPADVLFFENSNYVVAARLDTMLNRCWRIIEELDTFVTTANNFTISDDAYGAGWAAETTDAASKNALYDEIELRADLASPTFTGTVTVPATVTADEQLASKSFADTTANTLYVTTGVRVDSEPDDDSNDTTLVSGEWLNNTYTWYWNLEVNGGVQTTDANGDDKWQSMSDLYDESGDAGNGGLWLWGIHPYHDTDLNRTTDDTTNRTGIATTYSWAKFDDSTRTVTVGVGAMDTYPFLLFWNETTGTITFDLELYSVNTYTDRECLTGTLLFRIR